MCVNNCVYMLGALAKVCLLTHTHGAALSVEK